MVMTPYSSVVSQQGIGFLLASHLPKVPAYIVVLGFVLGMLLWFSFWESVFFFGGLFFIVYAWRSFWLASLRGFVGDSVGALIEVTEVAILLMLYFILLAV